jgi:hypothetical protein
MMNHLKYSGCGKVWLLALLLLGALSIEVARAQEITKHKTGNKPGFTMTSFAFGGTGILITKVNDQMTVMTGGRGSATFNNRFTFGGAGWGMLKGAEVESSEPGVYNFFKFGYGGLEFGYIFLSRREIQAWFQSVAGLWCRVQRNGTKIVRWRFQNVSCG